MMKVRKSDGSSEPVHFDKITKKITSLCFDLNMDYVDPGLIAKKVVEGMYDGINTCELDSLAADTCAMMTTTHPDYSMLAGRILVSRLHKMTSDKFSELLRELSSYVDKKTGNTIEIIDNEIFDIAFNNKEIDNVINYDLDFTYDFFAYKTLEKSYLLRKNGFVIERPQHLLMRVAIGIHKRDIKNVLKTYDFLSRKYYTHASPTLFNAGTKRSQMSSCFLVAMKEDSLEGIYDSLKECALISKSGAGIGFHIHNIRSAGSYIAGTNGYSNGIIPMLQVFNHTARYVDQGGGKRKGAFAVYLEPHHPEIFEFLELRKNHGKEELRTRDLFTALWIPDLFMKRVEADKEWSLFCPGESKGLSDVYGKKFDDLYLKYESQGKARKLVKARDLWFKILESQIETGTPYLLYKDACNAKSNQKNLGTIKSSNLCTEIIEYSDSKETAVCNLSSIALPQFVRDKKIFDFKLLEDIVYNITISMNRVIDNNYYPTEAARRSNTKHRPLGIGVQGLADVFMMLKMPFESSKAKQLNKDIFETIYYASMKSSIDLAKVEGHYESFKGSPLSEGKFQFDLWNVSPSARFEWEELRKDLVKYGARNSLLLAPMPTASTAQILSNNECFEPYTSNIYSRRTLSGEFVVINRHLVEDLISLGLWNESFRKKILESDGSVQSMDEIPDWIKDLYKTVWEIKQKSLIDMAVDRGSFICQSQSLNLFLQDPDFSKLGAMHFYAWKKGLKTGIYYLRSEAATRAQRFTLGADSASFKKDNFNKPEILKSSASENPLDSCEVCSS